MDAVLEDLHAYITRRVREGFDDEALIIDDAVKYAREQHGQEDLRPQLGRFTTDLIAAHREVQSSWETPTDCDKLDEAFAELEWRGIVARQNFTCCSNCGHDEIWGEIKQAGQTHEVKGYAFYHMQDTERACEGGELYLKYGSTARGEENVAEVGRAIVEELRRVGLQVEWNGRSDTAVHVIGIDWKRRR
jgi:hypothetical protein